MIILVILLYGTFIALSSVPTTHADISKNCSTGATPCGSSELCCLSGYTCNSRHGIPVCQSYSEQFYIYYTHEPCAEDPYLFTCDLTGDPGFCCPIGSVCYLHFKNNFMKCVDAYGTTSAAIPSATSGFLPAETHIPQNSSEIIYTPSHAWNVSSADSNCTIGPLLYISDTINATISFNFTGPSIIVHTLTSSNGGIFEVWVDGFDTQSTVDTYSGEGNLGLPLCYPLQFPPFIFAPPGLFSRKNHTISLIFRGRSPRAPNGIKTTSIQFDSFAIPQFDYSHSSVSSFSIGGVQITCATFMLLYFLIACCMMQTTFNFSY